MGCKAPEQQPPPMLSTTNVSMNHVPRKVNWRFLYTTNHLQNLQYQQSTILAEVNEDCMSKSFPDVLYPSFT